MNKIIRVLIADDHTIVRSGVRLLLEAETDIEVVGEALDGQEALALVEQLHPNVVLMDIAMPGVDGLEATKKIMSQWPETRILVLTMHRSDEYFFEMIKAGASGYVLKGAKTSELIHALRVVAKGEVFLYPSMAGKLVKGYLSSLDGSKNALSNLSKREQEILRLLADGYTNKEIAEKLFVSPSTVHSHRSNLMNKLNLNSRRDLIEYTRQKGILGT
ncbi:MAG: response regulator transcription factor [Anaerolineales bacterium]